MRWREREGLREGMRWGGREGVREGWGGDGGKDGRRVKVYSKAGMESGDGVR